MILHMQKSRTVHYFHIPVMGTGYSIDTPLKVAHLGIASVMSIIDHRLMEQMRKAISEQNNLDYQPIGDREEDSRARRITAYIDLVNMLARRKFDQMKQNALTDDTVLSQYFRLLPDGDLRNIYLDFLKTSGEQKQILREKLVGLMVMGEIEGNIMTKIDRVNFNTSGEALPQEFNDAHAALRGFVKTSYPGAVVLSAGLNPPLFNYMATFNEFYPDAQGAFCKKIVLKVSDFRSALIQGKYLAKKGLWVSEFRIESGVNCGGHAFPTDGFLMGPILQEFADHRDKLAAELFEIWSKALLSFGRDISSTIPEIRVSAQGGVGTALESKFLKEYYQLDSIGWGSPFLLAPDVTNVDEATLDFLLKAVASDFYLSDASPLGVRINAVRGSTAEQKINAAAEKGEYGSPCSKRHLLYNNEFTDEPICVASRQYMRLKIQYLKDRGATSEELQEAIYKMTQKNCLCTTLGSTTLTVNEIDAVVPDQGVTVCAGPNLQWFSKVTNLNEMVDHIYGRTNIISKPDRPNLFMQELKMYLHFYSEELQKFHRENTKDIERRVNAFRKNLLEGIEYYRQLFDNIKVEFNSMVGDSPNILRQAELELLKA